MIVFTDGCKPKQIVITNTKTDTTYVETVRTVEVPIDHTITIQEPCDSTGVLRRFKETFKTDHVEVTVSNESGSIVAEVNVDSLNQVWIREYEGKTETTTIEIPVDKPVPFIPSWVWWLLGYAILSIVYIFRRFIPILKFIP